MNEQERLARERLRYALLNYVPVEPMDPRELRALALEARFDRAWSSKCWFCGAPPYHKCVTVGGNLVGSTHIWSPHSGRGDIEFRDGDGHGRYPHCYPHDDRTLWERSGG